MTDGQDDLIKRVEPTGWDQSSESICESIGLDYLSDGHIVLPWEEQHWGAP